MNEFASSHDDIKLVETMYRRSRLAVMGELNALNHAAEEMRHRPTQGARVSQETWQRRFEKLSEAATLVEDAG